MKSVLVTGGTGFVGKSLVETLFNSGHKVTVLARGRKSRFGFPSGVRFVAGSVEDHTSVARALGGIDAVIHLVGIIFEMRGATYEKVHHLGTRNVISAMQQAGVRRYLHMSALGSRPHAVSRYHQTKWEAEEAVRQSGLDFTIIRPSAIFGAGDEFINIFVRLCRVSPIVPVLTTRRGKTQPVSVLDVAEIFLRSLESDQHVGKTYEIGGPEAFTLPELVARLSQILGKRRLLLPIPAKLLWPAAWLFEKFPMQPPVNREQLTMLEEPNVCDATLVEQAFGIKLRSLERQNLSYITGG
jgi:NADH dehydrogenase